MNRLLTNAPSCPEYFADVQYEAMCVERTWPSSLWRQALCAHPVTGLLCRKLVWECEQEGRRTTFTVTAPNTLIDRNGAPFTLSEEGAVRLAHESIVSEEVEAAWLDYLKRESIKPLFPQFGRMKKIRRVFPTYAGGLPSVHGIEVESVKFYRRAISAGFAKGPVEDGPTICEFFFRHPSTKLVGVLSCSGVDPSLLNSLTSTLVEAFSGEPATTHLESLVIADAEDCTRNEADPADAPAPFVIELAAAAARAVGEGLRLVKSGS